MPTLDDFFQQSVESPSDPRLRDWKRRLEQGAKAELELHRPDVAVGLGQTEMNLQFTERDGSRQSLESTTWNDELNAGLVELGVRAVDADNEAQRFALSLRAALRKAAREFGDGYFNAVLLEFIKESDLRSHPEIREVLQYTYGNPAEGSKSRDRCREMISDAITRRAHELTERLHYSAEDAKAILVSSITQYLDERFSVSSRRRMGLL
jgi:hypothetical protein